MIADIQIQPAQRIRDRERLWIVLTTVALNVVVVTALIFAPWSNWRTGLGLNLIDNFILVSYALTRRDRLMGRLILFGLLVGFVELATDAWIVDVTRSLDYSVGGELMLWRSPLWMPFAWEVVAVQFGYIGMRLYDRLGVRGLLLNGLLGAINIPYYEELARRIHWWRYHDTAMVPGTHTPWAILLGEFLIAASLGYLATWVRRGTLHSAAAGLCGGACTFVGYAIPQWLISRVFSKH